ncbi:MAG: YdcF family protein [Bacteroidetes bacterium]|nr:MAG: YdcF family protein [Bacteroidota bacterium]
MLRSVSTFFLLIIIVSISSCAFTNRTSRDFLVESMDEPYDIVVVPGVPLEGDSWSQTMKARVYWSKYLFDAGIAKNIMYSGSSVYTPYYEAKVMAMFAEAIGIPKQNIFVETKAEHSTENIYYSYKKAKLIGFKRIALASDPFQTKLLKRFTRKKVSEHIGLIPIVLDTLRAMEPVMIDPKLDFTEAFNKNFVSLVERETFWERLRGTRGLKLDETAYQ